MPEQLLEAVAETTSLSYAEAVNAALARCLEDIPETLLYGEDVGKPGGVFGVTRGLKRRFGDRVFDTPISESAILGSAVGAAMMGRRPIVEIMWIDFSLVALDQIVNQLANVRYINRGELGAPVVIRTQQGMAPGACAQHSQNLEALFLHIPGVRVCMPRTPQDAYDLLVSAGYSDDPVLVIENRNLYHTAKEGVVLGGPVEPIGGSRLRHTGDDITVVTWGSITERVLDAADILSSEGIELDVIEAVWLNPFDTQAVLSSVERTGHLLVVHEANVTGGFGAEVLSRVVESGARLSAPPRRLGVDDTRIPAAPSLAGKLAPSIEDVVRAARQMLR